MKKILSFLLIFTILISVTGCTKPVSTDNYKIVASFYPVMLVTKMVTEGVDGVAVTTLASTDTGCLHDYALMPNDMKNLETADMFVINGLGMESFLDKLKTQNTVDLSEGVTAVNNNPHIWLSPANTKIMVQNLSDALCGALPQYSAQFTANTDKYTKMLTDLDNEIKAQNLGGMDVITFHEAFDYFASEYGVNIAGTIQREPGEEPSTKELVETTKLIKEKNVKILLAEPQYSTTAADTLSRETGARVYMTDPVVTGKDTDSPSAYFEKLRENLQILKEAKD